MRRSRRRAGGPQAGALAQNRSNLNEFVFMDFTLIA